MPSGQLPAHDELRAPQRLVGDARDLMEPQPRVEARGLEVIGRKEHMGATASRGLGPGYACRPSCVTSSVATAAAVKVSGRTPSTIARSSRARRGWRTPPPREAARQV